MIYSNYGLFFSNPTQILLVNKGVPQKSGMEYDKDLFIWI